MLSSGCWHAALMLSSGCWHAACTAVTEFAIRCVASRCCMSYGFVPPVYVCRQVSMYGAWPGGFVGWGAETIAHIVGQERHGVRAMGWFSQQASCEKSTSLRLHMSSRGMGECTHPNGVVIFVQSRVSNGWGRPLAVRFGASGPCGALDSLTRRVCVGCKVLHSFCCGLRHLLRAWARPKGAVSGPGAAVVNMLCIHAVQHAVHQTRCFGDYA
jgi:hypothetical protein